MSTLDSQLTHVHAVKAKAHLLLRAADFVRLTKPRLTLLAVVAAAVGYAMAVDGTRQVSTFMGLLTGALLLGGGANALNQLMERELDGRMKRTADRPLPAGRLDPVEARGFGLVLAATGLAFLAAYVGWGCAGLGLSTLLIYLLLYTPLKQISGWNTVVGGVSGALPILMGWSAAGGALDLSAWTLFAIIFVWQLPHFWAICWCHRDDYARAGFVMTPLSDSSGLATGLQAIGLCVVLLIVSLGPTMVGFTGRTYFWCAIGSGAVLTAFAMRLALVRSTAAARLLFLASVGYLPLLMAAMLLDKLG